MVDIGALTLENGVVLDDVSIAVQRWGELSPNRDNVVVVLHALTGDSHITGAAGPDHPTPGWWDGVAGPGAPDRHRPMVRDRHQRVGRLPRLDRARVRWRRTESRGVQGSRAVTVRDQVSADIAALAALGITAGRRRRRRLDGWRTRAGVDRQPSA